MRFLGCAHATSLDLLRLNNPEEAPERAESDAMGELVQQAGLDHEAEFKTTLAAKGNLVEIEERGSLEERAAQTEQAMQDGAETIFQAAFLQPPWHGFADFLVRVDTPSRLGDWSYEPVDTKLARSAKAAHIVQLGLYARMLETIQGIVPQRVHAQLGDGTRASFRMVDFEKILEAFAERYLTFVEADAGGTRPEPCAACPLCPWRDHCAGVWEAEDHLCRVAGLGRIQARKLNDAGIDTVEKLATADEDLRVPRMAPATFSKLWAQARLQRARWQGGGPVVEKLPIEEGRGFLQLPEPDPADLFFDLEGDPLEEGGLDYLWGVHLRESKGPRFEYRWSHDHEAERVAFEQTIDWMHDHLDRHPRAHVYHYASYEISTLRRLSTLHASRENKLDNLLRSRRFVDLYAILRQAIRTSEPDLSLKTMEVFFADAREGDVTKADQSIIEYRKWRECGDDSILEGILEYNRIDCENTEALRDWLVSLRPVEMDWRPVGPPAPVAEEKTEERLAAEEAAKALIAAIENGPLPETEAGRKLVCHLTQFHRRADKPALWAMFDRCEQDADDLVDDAECIGALSPDRDADGSWQQKVKRSIEATYRFPEQDTKLRIGTRVLHAPTLMKMGEITALDPEGGTVSVKRMLKADEVFPREGSLIPEPVINNKPLIAAVHRVARCWAGGGEKAEPDVPRYRALLDIVGRRPPRLCGWSGGPLVGANESFIEAATARCLALDHSSLFIQGPPGTGKTHTSAHVIVSLLQAGKRVGVSSNSHKAINNLLSKIEEVSKERGFVPDGAKKASGRDEGSYLNGAMIRDVGQNRDVDDGDFQLAGGTAWLFADELFDQKFDYLFVDEAGQVSLGHLLAMGSAARNIVLIGDQMQLAQPIQGAHPGESGLSALDYLLQGEATVAEDAGILLDTSWRMHPALCTFISDAVYDGRLRAHPDCERQRLHLEPGRDGALVPYGLRFVPMDHEGCGQRSEEEVERIKQLTDDLIGTVFTDRDGKNGTLDWENILIVAPYNMQVNAIAAALPSRARVGTVDKFQGQEAEVVIVSLATSSPDDLPRHIEFFYSKNRINVAISRARTLALVLGNPKLLELDAKSVEHLRLVNTLAWVLEQG